MFLFLWNICFLRCPRAKTSTTTRKPYRITPGLVYSKQTGCVSEIRYQLCPVEDDDLEDEVDDREIFMLRQSIRDSVFARKLAKFQELGHDV